MKVTWVSLILLAGCDALPQDPERSLARARERGWLAAGIDAGTPEEGGEERAIVEAFARSLGLDVRWTRGTTHDLMTRLERFELDVAAAGSRAGDPWSKRVGFSRPWALDELGDERVIAVAPGENALLTALDRFLAGRGRR